MDLIRHILACGGADPARGRVPFRVGAGAVGWVRADMADALAAFPEVARDGAALVLREPDALPAIARALSDAGWFRWRREAFDVRADPDGPALARIDRGAIPSFGVMAQGVHVNGLVRAPDGWRLWVAKRAADKLLDPGKLDHVVAGGVPAGLTPMETLVKEAAEEAAIPAELAVRARHVGIVAYAMDRSEGLRRDRLHCYDLELPPDFVPRAADGEVESFELWPLGDVLARLRASDDFKFNVGPCLIDLFLRLGAVAGAEAAALRAALDAQARGA